MRVAVIGGGASGMTAAICAARDKHEVTIFEHMDRVGKKILVTGNGKCNLTNINQGTEFYHGTHPEYTKIIFDQYSYQDTLQFFTKLGIYTKNRNGGLYPYSEQASAVLDVLRMELSRLCVEIVTAAEVYRISYRTDEHNIAEPCIGFRLHMKQSNKDLVREFDRVIIATGSKAAKHTGSDGSGYALARSLGHTVIEPLPALVQLRSNQPFFKSIAGIRCDARLTLSVDGKYCGEERGELQLTDYGISGIPVFQLSSLASRALYEKKKVQVEIDFMPDMPTIGDMKEMLSCRIKACPQKEMQELLIGVFHKNLCHLFLKMNNIKSNRVANELEEDALGDLARTIKRFPVFISETNSFEQAQTCSGGISTEELTEHLESKIVPGIYFTGELIDIDGACGGYNLQWAWSTGMVAGSSLSVNAKKIRE